MAVAFHGHSGYRRASSYDPVPEWSAAGEALHAYSVAGDDESRVAAHWGEHIAANLEAFYQASPQRVRQLAQDNRGTLLTGFFVGTTSGQSKFFVAQIYLDQGTEPVVKYKFRSVPARGLPYASHTITDELIEGDTDRAKLAATEWRKRSKGLTSLEKEWRWMVFLISQTSEYTQDVGPEADVLDLSTDGKLRWLENHGVCPSQSKTLK